MSTDKGIGIGVIGCGHWGPNHIRTFSASPGARVAIAADLDGDRLASIGKLYPGLQLARDYQDILTDSSIQAAVIATPTRTHYKIAKEALEAGKHLLVEKPLCL